MERPKWVAVVTGVFALILSFGYLILVQLLDFRGEFKPAPIEPLGMLFSTADSAHIDLGQRLLAGVHLVTQHNSQVLF